MSNAHKPILACNQLSKHLFALRERDRARRRLGHKGQHHFMGVGYICWLFCLAGDAAIFTQPCNARRFTRQSKTPPSLCFWDMQGSQAIVVEYTSAIFFSCGGF